MRRSVAFTYVSFAFAVYVLASDYGSCVFGKDPLKILLGQQKPNGNAAFTVGDPVQYKNLTIFPVESNVPKNEDRFLTLEEGLKAGTVQVFEVGTQPHAGQTEAIQSPANQSLRQRGRPANRANIDPYGEGLGASADVNHLMVLNTSAKPLYLMPGEIIYGGQQDRTIAVEAIIPPGKTPVKLEVYCVEHGRWSARSNTETAQALAQLVVSSASTSSRVEESQAREKMAEEAKHGKFVAHAGSLNKSARAAVQEGKGQQEVWDKVGEVNAANSNQSQSGDFAANYTDPQMAKSLQGYIDAMQTPVTNQKQVVGAIVAINGKVEAVDVFQSTPLFKKIWPKLLKSHALDAAATAKDKDAEKVCSMKDAQAFLQDAMQAGVAKKSKGEGGLVVTKRDSAKVMSFSAAMPSASRSANAEFGDSVHSSAYKK